MVKNALEINLRQVPLKTPLMTASGTAGHLNELMILQNVQTLLDSLGAFVTKGVTLKPRKGNPELRVIETRTGLLNAIGLQNEGAEFFLKNELPQTLQ